MPGTRMKGTQCYKKYLERTDALLRERYGTDLNDTGLEDVRHAWEQGLAVEGLLELLEEKFGWTRLDGTGDMWDI